LVLLIKFFIQIYMAKGNNAQQRNKKKPKQNKKK